MNAINRKDSLVTSSISHLQFLTATSMRADINLATRPSMAAFVFEDLGLLALRAVE